MRRWKLLSNASVRVKFVFFKIAHLKPHDGQVQSPGRGRFFDGGKGVRRGGPPGGCCPAARSRTCCRVSVGLHSCITEIFASEIRTLDDDGATSIARSLSARPFIPSDSAAYFALEYVRIPITVLGRCGSAVNVRKE